MRNDGGWNPVDLWGVDPATADDILTVLQGLRRRHSYPDDLGFGKEFEEIWQLWREPRAEQSK